MQFPVGKDLLTNFFHFLFSYIAEDKFVGNVTSARLNNNKLAAGDMNEYTQFYRVFLPPDCRGGDIMGCCAGSMSSALGRAVLDETYFL
jgi:hypothetical protein